MSDATTKELREIAQTMRATGGGSGLSARDHEDIADEIDRLRAALAEMAEALKPFAEEAAELGPGIPDDAPLAIDNFDHIGWSDFTVGDLRRAKAALAKAKQEGGES